MITAQIKPRFLFYACTLVMCLNSFFLNNTDAQTDNDPTPASPEFNYTYESIDVPEVDFLALTASSDFEDYAGYARSPDGEKRSLLHSSMAFLRPMISRVHRTLISMRSAIMG